MKKQTFALCFANRGFFPGSLIALAKEEFKNKLENLGYDTLIMDESVTKYGAVENIEEGRKFAAFLAEHKGDYDGVILSLPNFGDESGSVTALIDCGTPIMIQAYPDEIGSMDPTHRRDAFCGKLSIMNVFRQYGLPFTIYKPHTVSPLSEEFSNQVNSFAATCRVVKKMKRMTVGAIGARTSAFKTVRFDEMALQNYGITTEVLDLSEVIMRVKDVKKDTDIFKEKSSYLKNYSDFSRTPDDKFEMLVKLSTVLDEIIAEHRLDCVALRCWMELEQTLGVVPCVLLSDLNNRGIPTACEMDVCSAISMVALTQASGLPATTLDWNNNYGNDENKCVLFHCGSVPQKLMKSTGEIIDHLMVGTALGPGSGWGSNIGRIADSPMTFSNMKTENGKISFYSGEGSFTKDVLEKEYFGCAGVADIKDLQEQLYQMGKHGFKHHVSVTFGEVDEPITEAFTNYLNYNKIDLK